MAVQPVHETASPSRKHPSARNFSWYTLPPVVVQLQAAINTQAAVHTQLLPGRGVAHRPVPPGGERLPSTGDVGLHPKAYPSGGTDQASL
jgi:hypothetical protein